MTLFYSDAQVRAIGDNSKHDPTTERLAEDLATLLMLCRHLLDAEEMWRQVSDAEAKSSGVGGQRCNEVVVFNGMIADRSNALDNLKTCRKRLHDAVYGAERKRRSREHRRSRGLRGTARPRAASRGDR
jgi:hypothetical protein